MTDELERAHRRLDAASRAATGPAATDIRTVADAVDDVATGEASADHAVVDGYLNDLRQVKRDASPDVESDLDAAIAALSAYRDDIEQA